MHFRNHPQDRDQCTRWLLWSKPSSDGLVHRHSEQSQSEQETNEWIIGSSCFLGFLFCLLLFLPSGLVYFYSKKGNYMWLLKSTKKCLKNNIQFIWIHCCTNELLSVRLSQHWKLKHGLVMKGYYKLVVKWLNLPWEKHGDFHSWPSSENASYLAVMQTHWVSFTIVPIYDPAIPENSAPIKAN